MCGTVSSSERAKDRLHLGWKSGPFYFIETWEGAAHHHFWWLTDLVTFHLPPETASRWWYFLFSFIFLSKNFIFPNWSILSQAISCCSVSCFALIDGICRMSPVLRMSQLPRPTSQAEGWVPRPGSQPGRHFSRQCSAAGLSHYFVMVGLPS